MLDNNICYNEFYSVCINYFPSEEDLTPATDVYRYEDMETALKVYLYLFLHCDHVKSCIIHKFVRRVPINFYVAYFRRIKHETQRVFLGKLLTT